MSTNNNGLIATSDVAGSGNADSVFFIRKGDPVVIDNLVANGITCDTLDLNGGLLTTTSGGTILTLNGFPVAGGINTITGNAPINITSGVNPVVSLNNSGVVAGTYPLADVTVNSQGLIATINAGTIPPNDDWSNFPAQTNVNMNNFKITTLATPTVSTDAVNKSYVDTNFVNLTLAQTIGGIKTFSSVPVCSTLPTLNDQLANKQYVDSAVSADALLNVLIAGNNAGANQIDMNNNKIVNCLNPTIAQDVATKSYVDTTAGAYLPLAGGTMTSATATINMNGADITNAGSIGASGITESVIFGSTVSPMLAFNSYATDITIGHYNPLTSMTLTSANDINVTAVEDINLQSKDINLTQTDLTSIMNLTAVGGIVIGAGLGVDITGGTTVQINSAGNLSLGSGNVLGADTEIEKIAFKDNEIYKVAGNADITIEDVASITNTGAGSLGTMLIQAEQNLTLNSTSGNVIVEGLTVNSTTVSGAGVSVVPTINTTATITTTGTGDVNINSQDQINIRSEGGSGFADITLFADDAISATCKGGFTAGSTLGITTIQGATTNITANPNGNVFINTTGTGVVAVNSQNNFTVVSNNLDVSNVAVGVISSSPGGQAQPILLLTNTNATGSVAMEVYKNKPTAGAVGDVLFNQSVYGKDSGNAKQEYTRISHTLRDATGGGEDGSMEFSCFVNGAVNTFLQLNGNENEVNVLKTLDMTGNTIRTNTGDMAITTATSAGTGNLAITSKGTTTLTGGDAINITNAGGSGNLTLATNGSILLTDGGTTCMSASSAGINFDTGGGAMNIIGASTRTIQTSGAGTGLNVIAGAGTNGAILTLKSSPDQAIILEGNSLTLNGGSMIVPSSGGVSGNHLQVQINGVNYVIELRNP